MERPAVAAAGRFICLMLMRKLLLSTTLLTATCVQAQDFWTLADPFQDNWYHVSDIKIVDESTVWVVGTNFDSAGWFGDWKWGVSTDAGLTWSSGYLPDDTTNPFSSNHLIANISSVSDQTAYVAAAANTALAQNKILFTQDAGATWSQIHPELFSGTNSWISGIHFFDAAHGLAYGDNSDGYFEIYTTADAALTWTRTPSANIPAPLAGEYVYFRQFDTTAGIFRFMTNMGRFFKSTDQGANWTVSNGPPNAAAIMGYGTDFVLTNRFAFKTATDGVFVTAENLWYKTQDGGETWNITTPNNTTLTLGVANVPQTTGTYYNTGKPNDDGTWERGIYSTNNGMDWNEAGVTGFTPLRTEFFSPQFGYASGFRDTNTSNNYGFYRLTDPLNRLLKNKSFLETFVSAAPNPASNQVTFSANGISTVELFDVYGKQISQTAFAEVNEAAINTQELQTGVYFAKVTASSGTQTLKIIKK